MPNTHCEPLPIQLLNNGNFLYIPRNLIKDLTRRSMEILQPWRRISQYQTKIWLYWSKPYHETHIRRMFSVSIIFGGAVKPKYKSDTSSDKKVLVY